VSRGSTLFSLWALCLLPLQASAFAAAQNGSATDPLHQASGSIQSLVRRVTPSVVQVVVTGYKPMTEDLSRTDVAVGHGRSFGSGAIIDPDGYIVTNAHLVSGAERIDVIIPADDADGSQRLGGVGPRVVQARTVGVAEDLDLALLAVDAHGLPALRIADYDTLRQGELVFAFGSPDGLRNSVSMGMVSAVARQVEEDSPIVYIQTDAAINPGNSGGPLVNVDGELVGINTFIRSISGGNEGLGFALPSALVALAYPQLRDYGRMHRAIIGVSVQTINPLLKAGLGLSTDFGLIVSDVLPGSPAANVGLRVGDIITALDGRRVDKLTLPGLYLFLYSLKDGQPTTVEVLRGSETLRVNVTAVVPSEDSEEGDTTDSDASLVEALAIFAVPLTERIMQTLPRLRQSDGVMVGVRIDAPHPIDVALEKGDVIHSVNGIPVSTPAELQRVLDGVERHGAVVLQVEREGLFTYMATERD
jgi:serine protease Do